MSTVLKLVIGALEIPEQVVLVVAEKLRDYSDDNSNVLYEALATRRNMRLALENQKEALAIRVRLLEEEKVPRFYGAEPTETMKRNHAYHMEILEAKAFEQEIRSTPEALAQVNIATIVLTGTGAA